MKLKFDAAMSLAKKVAQLGEYKHKVGAVILDKKGRVLSIGFNKARSHPYQAHFASKVGEKEKIYLHAEIMALIKAGGKGHSIFIARVTASGDSRLAKPCPICAAALDEAGISKIYYTGGKH